MIPSILVFGGGPLQLSLISNVRKLGYQSIVIDPDPEALGKNIADVFYTVAGDDFELTLDIATNHQVKGVVTAATDKPVLMMCRVACKLNLPFPSYDSCDTVLDKAKFKAFLESNNLPHAKGFMVEGNNLPASLNLSFPVITKPVTNSGSRGVLKAGNRDELLVAVKETLKHTKDGRFLIEEYIEGDEISVEALVQNGVVYIVQITDKIVSPPPYNVEMGHIQPSKYLYLKNRITELLQELVDKCGLDNCSLHPEMKMKGNNITIIEIGPRLGGDFITSHLVPLSSGVNMEEQLIHIACGKLITLNIEEHASMILYLDLPANSTIKSTITFEELHDRFPDVIGASFDIKVGERVERITNSLNRYGHYLVSGEIPDQLKQSSKLINEFLIKKIVNDV